MGKISNFASRLVDVVSKLNTGNISSLTEQSKDSIVNTLVYIEENLINEDITENLVSFLNQMCIGYILTALNAQSYVSSSKTVRDLLKAVSTEEYVDSIDVIKNNFGIEDLNNKPVISMEAGVISIEPKAQKLFSGRVVELNLRVPDGGEINTVTILVYVQLIPILMPSNIIQGFVQLNSQLPSYIKKMQSKAGVIRYWKDYLLAINRLKKEKELVLKDKSGGLDAMMRRKDNSIYKWVTNNVSYVLGGTKNANSANAIIVMEKPTFEAVCREHNIKFDNYVSRNKFFKDSFTMMMVVVDTMYNIVKIYFCGLESVGEYTFNNVSKSSSPSSGDNLKDILTAFSQNSAPRY